MLYPVELQAHIGRGGGIRTPDPLLPKQLRYQAALHPEYIFVSKANIKFSPPTLEADQ